MGSTYKSAEETTRTQGTVHMYIYRVAGIIKQACKSGYVADSNNVNPIDLSRWLIEHKGIYCASTYRQYRAALSMWFEESNHPDRVSAIYLLSLENNLASMKRCLSRKTSSTKDKKFSDQDREAIIEWLGSNRSRYSATLTVFLKIGPSVGLRPCEWKYTQLIKKQSGRADLLVINAKATNGRSNGDYRRLVIDDLPSWMIDVIDLFIVNIRRIDELGKWKTLYNGCRKTLYLACRSLWPHRKKYPTLYSLRHQFCADAKSAGMTKIEVAALMGHASDDTAASHYGKRRVGRGQCAVKPSEADIERLEIKLNSNKVDNLLSNKT